MGIAMTNWWSDDATGMLMVMIRDDYVAVDIPRNVHPNGVILA